MRRLALLALVIAGMSADGPAGAVVANPPPRLCAAYSSADAVIVGQVGAEATTANGDWNTWPIKVLRTYKGQVPGRFTAYSFNDSSRGTPNEGQINILFIHRADGRLQLSGSDPNHLATAGEQLALTNLSKEPSVATGSVSVLVAQEDGARLAGFKVRMQRRGDSKPRFATTALDGSASLELPPGLWSLRIDQPGWISRQSLYGYNDPERFKLARGGCADLRIEPIRLGEKK